MSTRATWTAAALAALAIVAARSVATERRATPAALLREGHRPASIAWALDRGTPSEPAWREAARPVAAEPLFVPALLFGLWNEEPLPAEAAAFLEALAGTGTTLERSLAKRRLAGEGVRP